MTDFTKYKNISVKKDTYSKIDAIRKVIVDDDPEVSILSSCNNLS